MTDLPGRGGQDQPQPGSGVQPGPAGYDPAGYDPASASYGAAGTGPAGYGQPVRPPGRLMPGGVPLRPLGLGDILSGIVSLIRYSPGATLGLNAIGAVVSGTLVAAASYIASRTGAGPVLIGELPVVPAYAVVGGGVIAAMGRAMFGRKIGIAEAVRDSRMGWVLVTSVVYWLLILGAWIVPVLLLRAYGVLLAVPLAAWLGITLWLAFPVVVLERRRTIAAMGRSWRLVRGSFWRLLGIFVLMSIISGVLLGIFWLAGSVAGVAGALLSGRSGSSAGFVISEAIAALVFGFMLSAILTGLWTGLTVLLYADMRMRKEGIDLLLAQAAADRQLTGEEFASLLAAP